MTIAPLFRCLYAAATLTAAAPAGPSPTVPSAAPAPVAKKTPAPVKDDANVWAGKVQKAYEGVKDFSATFEQDVTVKSTTASKSTGTIAVQKPGKMRWEFATPEKKVFVSDGKTMWMYEAAENQVIVNENMAATTSVTALNFLEGFGKLREEFAVALATPRENAGDKTLAFLSLRPKEDADVQFTEIVLGIDRKTSLAAEVWLVDSLGNETHLTFKDRKTNQNLPAKTFTFDIPKNAEVIRPAQLQ